MEKEAYSYAREQFAGFPERSTEKISMAEIFDLVAGTSTGSLLATALVIPNNDTSSPQPNKFFSDRVIEVYQSEGATVFTKYEISNTLLWVGVAVFIVVGALLGLCIGVHCYHNPQFEENMKMLKQLVKTRKQTIRGKMKQPLVEVMKESFRHQLMNDETEKLKHQIEEGNMSIVNKAEENILD